MKEERKRQRKIRKIKAIIRLAVILIIAGFVVFILKAPLFNVDTYIVNGNSYYNDNEILVMGNCKTGGNIFTDVDLNDMKDRLLRDAYMADVEISRIFPSTIQIDLVERHQIAAIVYGEKYVVIDDTGVLLRKTSVDPKLTILSGFTITDFTFGKEVKVNESVQLMQALDIINSMEDNDMYFVKMNIDNAIVNAYVLENLKVRGSASDIITCMENGGIQGTVKELFSMDIERGTIIVTNDHYISYTPEID